MIIMKVRDTPLAYEVKIPIPKTKIREIFKKETGRNILLNRIKNHEITLRIPKAEIRKLVKRELNKHYPTFELRSMRKRILELEKKLRVLDNEILR